MDWLVDTATLSRDGDMNVQQLRAFVMVVEHGSFSEAARALGLSQPAVTMQVQALESAVGATLLDRRYRRVELTDAGELLLPHARRVLAEIEEARDRLEDLSGRVTGRLAIAASTTPGQYILPRLLGGFLGEFPEVGVSLRVHDTAEVVAAVEAGEAGIGMTGAKVAGTRVEFVEAGTDDLVLVCPPGSPLARKATLADVAEEPFIMRERGSGTRIVMEDTLRTAGIDPGDLRVVLELGTNEAIVSAVEGGVGVGVVSRWVADKALRLGTVEEVPEARFPVRRPLYVVMPKTGVTRAADALRHFLLEELPRPTT